MTTPDWGGLEVQVVDDGRGRPKGGRAVVLLHGWGAAGDDLVPLAQHLARSGTRFFVPAAPLPHPGGGRAWWHLDGPSRPAYAQTDEPPASASPHPALLKSRTLVQKCLRQIRERFEPERLVLAGFSQGGMLSIDVALAADPPVDRVAVLSGVLPADSVRALIAPHARKPAVFISHGRHDPVIPFAAAEVLKTLLVKHGFTVDFHPFEGGHEIPQPIVDALAAFIDG